MKNQVALHACYWSGTRIGEDLNTIIEYTARIKPDLIEFTPAFFVDMPREQRLELRKRTEDKGMGITVNSGLITAENDVSSPVAEYRAAGLKHCRRLLEACSEVGSPYWSGLMHSAWCLKPDFDDPQGDKRRTWDRSVAGMREVSKMAEDVGVVCSLEVVNRYEHFLLNTAEDAVKFCEQVGSPYCKLLLDVFHMSIEEDNMGDAVRYAMGRGQLSCLHLGETNRRIPVGGKTNIKWDELRDAILESGYSGPMVLEPLMFATSATAAKTCLWRSLNDPRDLDGLVELGKKAVGFTRRLCA